MGRPCQHLDIRMPQRANEHESFFGPRETRRVAEPEKPCIADDLARLFEDLAAERLCP
jgi:hypothetical protein